MEVNPQFQTLHHHKALRMMYLEQDVSTLEECVLYKSSVHNGFLFDALLVDHQDHKVIQSSSFRADKHLQQQDRCERDEEAQV
jgi:hypothetical protein